MSTNMRELRGHHFCLLAHNVVNKLTAILGHCEILDGEASESPRCIEQLHKIRDLASAAAAMLQSGECENESVTRILELENAFAAAANRTIRGTVNAEQETARAIVTDGL